MTVENESLDNKDKKGKNDNDNSVNDDSLNEDNKIDKNSKEFKDLLSQEVEKIIQSRIAREVQKTNTIESELESLKKVNEELLEDNKNLKLESDSIIKDNIVYKVALEDGLSVDVIKSLKGDTYEEIKESVKNIKSLNNSKVDDIFDGKSYGKMSASLDFDSMIKNMKM